MKCQFSGVQSPKSYLGFLQVAKSNDLVSNPAWHRIKSVVYSNQNLTTRKAGAMVTSGFPFALPRRHCLACLWRNKKPPFTKMKSGFLRLRCV